MKPQVTQALDPMDERVGLFEEREVAQKALEFKKPFLVGGRGKSSELSKGQKQERKIISLMSFPLSSKGEIMGVASVVLINEENGFDEKNMQFFSSFANLASIALEMSELPEGGHKQKGTRISSGPGKDDTPAPLASPPEKEGGWRTAVPFLKIKVEGRKGFELLNKAKVFRAPDERAGENILDRLPSMTEKENRSDDIPLVKIKAEPKTEGKREPEVPKKEKIFQAASQAATVKIPAQPQSTPEKKLQPAGSPAMKKKAEQRVEEPRVIEGPNKEKIAWAPGTVTIKEEAGAERRTEERIETTVRAEFQEEYWGVTKNLSNGGAFIVTSTPLDLGDEIVLKLHIPDGGEELELNCKVVWTNQYGRETQDMRRGMGVKFLSLQPEAQRRIHSYIEFEKNRTLRLAR